MVTLTQAIEALKHTPVGIQDLKKLVPPQCKVIKLAELKGKHRRQVFGGGVRALIVLLPSKVSKVGHYITLIGRTHHIEYFSSLGNSMERESKLLHSDQGILKQLLGANYIYNRTRLQGGAFKIRTCAMFCVARCFLSDLKLREFVPLFTNRVSLTTPDDIVSLMNFLTFQDV
jgi:hypothetical protein